MRQIQHYQFDAPHCALFETHSRTTFVVGRGRLWITIEGDGADYWLAAGETLDVAARQRVWLSAEAVDTCLDVVADRFRVRPPSRSPSCTPSGAAAASTAVAASSLRGYTATGVEIPHAA
ncbi:MAG: DUF2917 domain-containing protein [Janthinobacterium lividum]